MLAKVIAHGRTRADAAKRLARTLTRAEIHGVTTNRDLLAAILREPEFLAGQTDTGYLARHSPAELMASRPGATALHALVAALARQAVHRAEAPVLTTLPSGWRNVRSAPQRVTYTAAGPEFAVAYRVTDGVIEATVNHEPMGGTLLLHAAGPELVDLEVDGLRHLYRVHRVGAQTYVDASNGSSALAEVPRFGQPDKMSPTGSLIAPMPGLVLRVLASAGATVTSGQPLVVLEAMKMEQTVTAPADGVVAELRVKAGEQVNTGQVLAVVTAQNFDGGGPDAQA
jgi:acetyl/propionyl-CoA carboxylase alpha subunit